MYFTMTPSFKLPTSKSYAGGTARLSAVVQGTHFVLSRVFRHTPDNGQGGFLVLALDGDGAGRLNLATIAVPLDDWCGVTVEAGRQDGRLAFVESLRLQRLDNDGRFDQFLTANHNRIT